jgi:hypothetical protein
LVEQNKPYALYAVAGLVWVGFVKGVFAWLGQT